MTVKLKFEGVQMVANRTGKLTVMNRNGDMIVIDSSGRERDRMKLVYGAILKYKEGDEVKKGDVLAEWDPYSNPIVADLTGVIQFQDIEEGVTMTEQVDSVTGFATKVIMESKGADNKPTVLITDGKGKTPRPSRSARFPAVTLSR